MKTILITICLLSISLSQPVKALSKEEIDTKVEQTLNHFYRHSTAGQRLISKAYGALIFPDIVKAGIGVGIEYGEGVLRINEQNVGYYSSASGSIGLQLGLQVKSQIILFMDKRALDDFKKRRGWKVGVDGSVTLIKVGVGGEIDTDNALEPIIGFVFSQKGLMYDLSLEGTKFTPIKR